MANYPVDRSTLPVTHLLEANSTGTMSPTDSEPGPSSFLIMTYDGKSVSVSRDDCLQYEAAIAIAQHSFPSLSNVSPDNLVLRAEVRGPTGTGIVEISSDTWFLLLQAMNFVTIELRQGSEKRIRKIGKRPVARKPVIYLYPPSSLSHVTVQLSLASSWSFSAVYPQQQTFTTLDGHESLTWTVAAEPDGTLVDKTTGTEVSYLYWEAIVNPHVMTPDASRASTPVGNTEPFDPSRPSVTPGNSILLPIGKVPGYLDAALKALTLHTEARTSFITYWLPDLLKHEHVALRFLAQESYEHAAPMLVSPTPDVVTRVFMLFRGVASADVECWQSASALESTAHDATSWARVVGVDSARASDRWLFRVLEWGGMEVN